MERLNSLTVKQLSDQIVLPQYDRKLCGTGIIHFGIGAFHRAHQAVYTDTVLGMDRDNWRICGVSLRSPGVRDQLLQQDNLYSVVEKHVTHPQYRLIGSISDAIFAPENPKALLERLINPEIRIVSLTITEKGYHHDPARACLNQTDPDVKHDLEKEDNPKTAIGYLVRALEKRRQAGIPPFTVLSCDNLPENGHTLRRVVFDFAALINDRLSQWIEKNVAFPCTMVDRIVPATTNEDRDFVQSKLGVRDEAAVVTEPFCQWIIEDDFPEGRPSWERAGAIFSTEVKAFELMKLRMLNGSHSILAYLGYLNGMNTIAECLRWDAIKSLILVFMKKEILPTLHIPLGFDVDNYINELIQRFANPGLNHKLLQVAMDGSQKIPPRFLSPIRDQLASSKQIAVLTLVIAGWMRFVCGKDENGIAIPINDPMAKEYESRTRNFRENPDETVMQLLGLEEIFGKDLPANEMFCGNLKIAFRDLCSLGTKETVSRLANKLNSGN